VAEAPPVAAEDPGRGWLGGLLADLGQLADRALDRHLRLAVTGLRRSGKTVLTTALAHHLQDGRDLPFLAAVHEGRYLGARPLPVSEGEAFPLARYAQALGADPPAWPTPTERLSQLRLGIRFRTTNALLRPVQPIQELTLEIVDYPGEWLLDLPLLEASFEQFSEAALELAQEPARRAAAEGWVKIARALDQEGPPEAAAIDRLVGAYTTYLRHCQRRLGLALIQPGRLLSPGPLAGSPALRFAPLPPAPTRPRSLRAAVAEAFERYREEVVRAFYEEHFRRFDRQIVLVDLLAALNQGPAHLADTQRALALVADSFRYGRTGLLGRLFAPRIDRILFAASKADHVAPSQHAALRQLLETLVAPAGRGARFEGIEPQFLAIAALRCTEVVRTEHQGQVLSCVRGRLKDEPRETVLFPGEIPAGLPEPEDWDSGRFRFREFAPRRLRPGERGQHIRLDQALDFLIGDKLR
jgi:predicted YcjX-like family ATPase